MKTLYINGSSNITVDQETNEVGMLSSEYERISRIYLAPEDMHVVFGREGVTIEKDVKEGELIITFYEGCYENRMIIVHNDEWRDNLIKYHEKLQQEKEEWAAKQKKDNDENDATQAG